MYKHSQECMKSYAHISHQPSTQFWVLEDDGLLNKTGLIYLLSTFFNLYKFVLNRQHFQIDYLF